MNKKEQRAKDVKRLMGCIVSSCKMCEDIADMEENIHNLKVEMSCIISKTEGVLKEISDLKRKLR